MRITFITAGGFGLSGGHRAIATYAQLLHQRGHEVSIISRPVRPVPFKQQVKSLVQGKGWIAVPKQHASHFDNIDVPCRLLDRFRPVVDADVPDGDVVIATWWETAEWVANLSASKGAKVYFVQHHEVFDYLPKEQVAASYSLPLHKIVVSNWIADIMRTQYNDRTVSYIPYSVDTDLFNAPPRGKQPIPTVGMMYKDTPWKGCDISLKAFALAAQRFPNLRLVAFGAKPPTPDLPLPPNTEYTLRPPQAMIKEIYAKCDAWLFGSRVEGFGMPILEAMACRTPVIGTPAGAAPDFITNGAGVLVKPEDPEDMARAIEHICSLPEPEWKRMSDLAYHKVTSYTWDDAAQRFEAALFHAIERQLAYCS